ADHVFTLGEALRADLVERGIAPDDITVVPNFCDRGRAPLSPSRSRAALGVPREGFWVGTTSSMVDYEGLDTIVRAIGLARGAEHDVRALLVGDGVSLPGLRALIRQHALEPYILTPGRVPREKT